MGVVATTLISLPSMAGQPASSDPPPAQATRTSESARIANFVMGFVFI